jgi:hypothetical protein
MERTMTKEDRGHYAKKHSPGREVNTTLAGEVGKRAGNGKMACAVAFDIAENLGVSPAEVGFTLDMLEIRLIKCQLGLFGYGSGKKIAQATENMPESLEKAIRAEVSGENLSCATAWRIAGEFRIGKMKVSSACEALGIKIKPCQLGAF